MGEPVQVHAAAAPAPVATPQAAGGLTPSSIPMISEPATGLRRLPVAEMAPSRFQPRREFDEAALKRLADSIGQTGMMQPVLVRAGAAGGAKWELVAGERRWRAAKIAGLDVVPAIVTELSDRDAAEWSIVENVQREDLTAMERAWAFRRLGETFGLSHGEIAARVAIDRSSVANFVRLTELEQEIQDLLASARLSPGHGKALLGMPAGAARIGAAKRAAESGWSVRKLEQLAKSGGVAAPASEGAQASRSGSAHDRREAARQSLEKRIGERLGTRAKITTNAAGTRGQIRVEFYDLDHLQSVLSLMGVGEE